MNCRKEAAQYREEAWGKGNPHVVGEKQSQYCRFPPAQIAADQRFKEQLLEEDESNGISHAVSGGNLHNWERVWR